MNKQYMTKNQVWNIFKNDILPFMPTKDKIAARAAWNDFTDFLCKDGSISPKQYQNWDLPRELK